MSRLASIPYADLTARQRYQVARHLRRYASFIDAARPSI